MVAIQAPTTDESRHLIQDCSIGIPKSRSGIRTTFSRELRRITSSEYCVTMEQSKWTPKPATTEVDEQVRGTSKLFRGTILHSLCGSNRPLLIAVYLDLQSFLSSISSSNTLLALTCPRTSATATPYAHTIARARTGTTVPPASDADIPRTRPSCRSLLTSTA